MTEENFSDILKRIIIPFDKFFKKKPKEELSEEEIEAIKKEIRKSGN